MIGEIDKMIRHNGQRFRRLKCCGVGASCLSHAVPTEPTYQPPQLIEKDNNNAMSTPNANGAQSGVEGSQHSMTSSLSPIPDSQLSTTHSQSSTTRPPSSKPPTPHPQPLAFGPHLAFTDPQVSGDPQPRIDPPLAGIDSTPVPDSQTVADAPSYPDVRQDPPETSGSVAVGQDTGAVDPQPIIIHEYNQTMYDNATLIPDAVSAQIPSPTDSVASLLNRTTFPPMSSGSVEPLPATLCVLDETVPWTIDGILETPVPPQEWTSDLELEIKARMHTGARPNSVQHPTIPGLRLPLWIVEFWKSVSSARSEKQEWDRAATWLMGQAARGEEVSEAEKLFRRIPWGAKLWMLSEADTLIGLLAELLSTGWLRERHLDLFSIYLTDRAGEGECEWLAGGVYVTELLKRINPAEPLLGHGTLAGFAKEVIEGKYKKVLLPANINGNHWIIFFINLDKRTLAYGA